MGLIAILVTPLVSYTLWHLIGILLSLIELQKHRCISEEQNLSGKVAILYPTCDDFNPKALATLLRQEGVKADIFILDDSTQAKQQCLINEWIQSQVSDIQVVRRLNKEGYKGGNINYWLSLYGDSSIYPYILIVDADELLPPDFTLGLLKCLKAEQFVFAQGCHLGNSELYTRFQSILHLQVETEWFYQVPAKNITAMPPMLGHGVLLKTKLFLDIGGFPDLVSEDLALTIKFAEKGCKGIIAPHVIAREEFPRNYRSYWKRRKRWIRADTEVVKKMLKNMLHNKLGWVARLDLIAREFRLPMASSYWFVLLLLAFSPFSLSEIVLPPIAWGGAFFFLTPALPAFWIKRVAVMERIRYILSVSFLGATTIHLHPFATAQGIVGFTHFEPTGVQHNVCANTLPEHYWWDILAGLPLLIGGMIGGNWVIVAMGFSISYSLLLRTFSKHQVLTLGTVIFWGFLILQVFLDISNGSFSISHLAALVGLAITLI